MSTGKIGGASPAPRRLALLIWLLGLAASAVTGWTLHVNHETQLRARFEALSDEFKHLIADRFDLYANGVRGLRGAIVVAGGETMTRRQFAAYIADRENDREYPGARGFGFIQRVTRAQEQAFLADVRAEGPADFSIREFAPHSGDLFVTKFIYPLDTNKDSLGLNIASEASRREAALEAARTGEPRLTAPITLVQATTLGKHGFLLLLPVYKDGVEPASPATREAAAIGWAYAPLVVDEILKNLGFRREEIAFTLTDAAEATPFYKSLGITSGTTGDDGLTAQREVTVFGRTWRMWAKALPPFVERAAGTNAGVVTATLAVLATLLAAVAFALLQSRQKRAELRLEQERFAASIVAAAPQALLVVDETGRITRVNRVATEMFGYTMEELVGRCVDDLVPPVRRGGHAQLRHQYDFRSRDMAAQMNLTAWRRDGKEFGVSVQLAPLEVDGRRYVVAGVTDVTEQRAARAMLAQSEQRWQEVANCLPHLVWTCAPDGTCDFLSKRWVDYTGLPAEEQLGTAWQQQVHPEDRAALARAWERSATTLEPFNIEFRIRRHDGVYRWFDTRGVPLLDADGQVMRWIGSNTDIEERHAAEQQVASLLGELEQRVADRTRELEAVQRDLRNIVDAVPSMIGYWDRDLYNRFANKAYGDRFGLTPEEAKGRHIRELLGDALFERTRPFIEAALRGEPQRFENEVFDASGAVRYTQAHYLPDIHGGQTLGFYVLIFDVTEIKSSEAALKEAKEVAEAATRAKSVFLTSMSHELRTPMNSVLGFSDLILSQRFGPLNEKQLEFMRLVQGSAKHLLALMSDVLELSKIESGGMTVSMESVHPTPLIRSAMATLQPLAENRRVQLKMKTLASMNLAIRADARRMLQVMINLGSNAIKYNRPGGWVEFSCEEPSIDRLRVRVTDNGMGIPIDRQAELFQPFNRLGAEQSAVEGTGIGLTLTKSLVEIMGGSLGFESREGKGSSFWVDFPIDTTQCIADAQSLLVDGHIAIPQVSSPMKVLYVEDNEQNRILFRNYVSLVPAVELIETGDGVDGLQMAIAQRPNIIFLDINLPGLDGYQILRQIKSNQDLQRTPVIALSANAMEADVARGLAAGFTRYLSKPVSLSDVLNIIATFSIPRTQEPAPTSGREGSNVNVYGSREARVHR